MPTEPLGGQKPLTTPPPKAKQPDAPADAPQKEPPKAVATDRRATGGTARMSGIDLPSGIKLDGPGAPIRLGAPKPPMTPVQREIDAYRKGYNGAPFAGKPGPTADAQASEPYVTAHDPLHKPISAGTSRATVSVGVDPGDFFCAGQAKTLADYKTSHPDTVTGFIHIPPDQTSVRGARDGDGNLTHPDGNPNLPTREDAMAMTAQVLGTSVRAIADRRPGQDTTVVLTGFGPFRDAPDNGSEAFLHDANGEPNRANLDKMMEQAYGFKPSEGNPSPIKGKDGKVLGYSYQVDGRRINVVTGVMKMAPTREAANAGQYDPTMDGVNRQFNDLLRETEEATGSPPNGILSLGVDAGQNDLKPGQTPRFKLETQSRGFDGPSYMDPTPNPQLAELWLERERR